MGTGAHISAYYSTWTMNEVLYAWSSHIVYIVSSGLLFRILHTTLIISAEL